MRLFVLLLASTAACGFGSDDVDIEAHQRAQDEAAAAAVAALPRCAAFAPPDVGGPTVELERFTLQLPREYAKQDVHGIDSYVVQFAAPGRLVSSDYGAYSNPLSNARAYGLDEYRACHAMIDGRIVRVVTARRDTLHLVGAAWRDLAHTGLGAMHLTITLESVDVISQDEAMRILGSVRFP